MRWCGRNDHIIFARWRADGGQAIKIAPMVRGARPDQHRQREAVSKRQVRGVNHCRESGRASSSLYLPLDASGCRILADALGDTPETVISVHLLRRALCRAYVAGDPLHFDGAIIQDDFCPAEPMGFGTDPEVLWDLLRAARGWECVNVAPECAAALGEIIQEEMGVPVRYYGDLYHALSAPVCDFRNGAVREFTLADLGLLESAPVEVRASGFGSTCALLTDGIVAGAVVCGQIVSLAHTYARSKGHADIGVFTLEGWRSRGFATAAAAIVARRGQEAGQTPVWSTGERNVASLRVAHKLGFTQVLRRTYVILDRGS